MQEFNLICGKDERALIIGKMQRMFSSSNINVLLGSAFSLPYLKTLDNVEKSLSEAMEKGDKGKEYKIKREFFQQSIEPVIGIDFDGPDFVEKREYIRILKDIVALRETSVVHKIVNVFTTNYDNLIENALEKNHIDYFDGFDGRINPKFSTANYGKLICRQNGFQGRLTEEVSVNLFKIHGSLYWREENGSIFFEDFKKVAVPFLDAKTYGRSIYENSSFIASSKNPNESYHGKGFVARLSGSTIEFISMWKLMMFGAGGSIS